MTEALATKQAQGWNVDLFRRFWNDPKVEAVRKSAPAILTEDIVGVWPHGTVVRGREEYVEAIARLLTAIPDFRAEVKEHAVSGEFTFIRWEATGTHEGARFVAIGADRVRLRDGRVSENLILSDHPVFRVVASRRGTA